MIKNKITIDEALEYLNSLIDADREAINELIFNKKVSCNEMLENHPSCQVGGKVGDATVGLLGILSGLFGVDDNNCGAIAVKTDGCLKFIRYNKD